MSDSNNMCFTLPNLEPIGSELDAIVAASGEANSKCLLQLPHPSPTDVSTLFLNQDRSHARRQHPGHIPRPRNAFILFRCDFVQQRVPEDVVNDHRDLSRIAGYMWRKMSVEQKQPWFEKAELEKRYHAEVFPLYRYAPMHPERPKRVYHKKKPLVPEEILLRDPHSFQVRPRLSSSPQHSFPSTSPPVLPPRFTDAFDNESPAIQHQGFPQSYTRYHSTFSTSHSSAGQAGFRAPASINHPSLTPPSAFCGGLVNILKQGADSVDWEFSPPDSRYYELRAHWPDRETADRANPAYLNQSYPRIPENSSTSTSEPDSLYNMWKNLETFHDQPVQPGVDLNLPASSSPYSDEDRLSHYRTSSQYAALPSPIPTTTDYGDCAMSFRSLPRSS